MYRVATLQAGEGARASEPMCCCDLLLIDDFDPRLHSRMRPKWLALSLSYVEQKRSPAQSSMRRCVTSFLPFEPISRPVRGWKRIFELLHVWKGPIV
jgi:hypothetical protein